MKREKRPRSCHRYRTAKSQETARGSRQICIPMTPSQYATIWPDAAQVRRYLAPLIQQSPELFPPEMHAGYWLTGHLPESKKMPGIRLRQLQTSHGTYTLRPSFVMSYMTGTVSELEHPLFLMSLGVPCWAITRIYGHNDMYWYRHLERLGRNRLVGTTVSLGEHLPKHLVADEHHADWGGRKRLCGVHGRSGVHSRSSALCPGRMKPIYALAMKFLPRKLRALNPEYQPETVNIDGWQATRNAFVHLFNCITPILCFLHGFISIRDRSRQEHGLHQALWQVYHSDDAEQFRDQMEQFWRTCQAGALVRCRHGENQKVLCSR